MVAAARPECPDSAEENDQPNQSYDDGGMNDDGENH
jgi:hypothetical protein